jgi:uncharacterized membrane protein YhaH (DUF805 family)
MFCSQCGFKASDGSKFCSSCGYSLQILSKVEPEETPKPPPSITNFSKEEYASKHMGFSSTVKFCYQNYANFNGRASVSEYWFWVLYQVIAGFGGFVFASVVTTPEVATILLAIFVFTSLIPNIARGIRRLHDIGKPGTYLFFSFIPLVGNLLLFVWFCTKGQPEDNKWGPALILTTKSRRGLIDIVSGE